MERNVEYKHWRCQVLFFIHKKLQSNSEIMENTEFNCFTNQWCLDIFLVVFLVLRYWNSKETYMCKTLSPEFIRPWENSNWDKWPKWDHSLLWIKQTCFGRFYNSMCKIPTRTQSLSCALAKLSYCCREEKKVVNKMCSGEQMKEKGRGFRRTGGDWIMRQRENKVTSENILIFILVSRMNSHLGRWC